MGVLQPANWARPLEPWLVGARARQSGLPIFCGSGRPTRTALGCFRSLALEGLSAPCRSSRTSWYRRGKCVLVLLALAIVKILDMASCLRACTGRRGRLSRRGRWRRGASLPPRLFTGSSARARGGAWSARRSCSSSSSSRHSHRRRMLDGRNATASVRLERGASRSDACWRSGAVHSRGCSCRAEWVDVLQARKTEAPRARSRVAAASVEPPRSRDANANVAIFAQRTRHGSGERHR